MCAGERTKSVPCMCSDQVCCLSWLPLVKHADTGMFALFRMINESNKLQTPSLLPRGLFKRTFPGRGPGSREAASCVEQQSCPPEPPLAAHAGKAPCLLPILQAGPGSPRSPCTGTRDPDLGHYNAAQCWEWVLAPPRERAGQNVLSVSKCLSAGP